jgi:hypothetical protein
MFIKRNLQKVIKFFQYKSSDRKYFANHNRDELSSICQEINRREHRFIPYFVNVRAIRIFIGKGNIT